MLTQTYQMLQGTLREGQARRPISDARLDGTQIRFSVGGQRYTGQVTGGQMQGTVNGQAWIANRAAP